MAKKKTSTGAARVMRAGIATGLAGAYYFLGPEGKEHQKTAKAFVKKLKGQWEGTKHEVRPGKKKRKVHVPPEKRSTGRKQTKTSK